MRFKTSPFPTSTDPASTISMVDYQLSTSGKFPTLSWTLATDKSNYYLTLANTQADTSVNTNTNTGQTVTSTTYSNVYFFLYLFAELFAPGS